MDNISGVTYTTLVYGTERSSSACAMFLSAWVRSPVYAMAGMLRLIRWRVWSLMSEINGDTTKVTPLVFPVEQIAGSWSANVNRHPENYSQVKLFPPPVGMSTKTVVRMQNANA